MTDKQQIEEMVEVIGVIRPEISHENDGKRTVICMCNRTNKEIAEHLYKANYRRVGESEMVVTKDEWEDLQGSAKAFDTLFVLFRVLVASLGEVSKATAKDFIFKVESYLGYNDDNETFTKKELLLILAEVAKEQYGVEVDE